MSTTAAAHHPVSEYYRTLSNSVIDTMNLYANQDPSVSILQLLTAFKIVRQINVYFPMSTCIFPDQQTRDKIFRKELSSLDASFYQERNTQLTRLCTDRTSIEVLLSLKIHIEECIPSQSLDNFTPCIHVIATLHRLSKTRSNMNKPKHANMRFIYVSIGKSLAQYFRENPTSKFHKINSLNFDVDDFTLRDLITSELLHNVSPHADPETITFPRKLFSDSIPIGPKTTSISISYEHMRIPSQSQPSTSTRVSRPNSRNNDHLMSTFTFPELDNPISLPTDPRLCIIYAMDRTYLFNLFSSNDIPLNSLEPQFRAVDQFVREYYLLRSEFSSNDHEDYPNFDSCSRIARALIIYLDGRRRNNTLVTSTSRFFETHAPLHWKFFYYWFYPNHANPCPPHLRQKMAYLTPVYFNSVSYHSFIHKMCYLYEFVIQYNGLTDYVIPTPAHDSLSEFMRIYPRINTHSLRLMNYIREYEYHRIEDRQTRIDALINLVNQHDRGHANWFSINLAPMEIMVNGRLLSHLSSYMSSIYDNIRVSPDELLRTEVIVLRRQRYQYFDDSFSPRIATRSNTHDDDDPEAPHYAQATYDYNHDFPDDEY